MFYHFTESNRPAPNLQSKYSTKMAYLVANHSCRAPIAAVLSAPPDFTPFSKRPPTLYAPSSYRTSLHSETFLLHHQSGRRCQTDISLATVCARVLLRLKLLLYLQRGSSPLHEGTGPASRPPNPEVDVHHQTAYPGHVWVNYDWIPGSWSGPSAGHLAPCQRLSRRLDDHLLIEPD